MAETIAADNIKSRPVKRQKVSFGTPTMRNASSAEAETMPRPYGHWHYGEGKEEMDRAMELWHTKYKHRKGMSLKKFYREIVKEKIPYYQLQTFANAKEQRRAKSMKLLNQKEEMEAFCVKIAADFPSRDLLASAVVPRIRERWAQCQLTPKQAQNQF